MTILFLGCTCVMSREVLPRNEPEVIIGTTICRRSAFLLDEFLRNQQEIQQAYPLCKLVLATDELDFVKELTQNIQRYDLRAEVITYQVSKPDYARSRVWSIACGRETLRQYVLSEGVDYLLFLDADMVYEPSVVDILKSQIRGFDVVASGYELYHTWGFGCGCLMLGKDVLGKVNFRCYEFKNGVVLQEDAVLDIDLFKCHARVKKGIFVSVRHYQDRWSYKAIQPRAVGWFRAIVNSLPVRYILMKTSIWLRYNIPGRLQAWCHSRLPGKAR